MSADTPTAADLPDDAVPMPQVRLGGPMAGALADLYSLAADLKYVALACDALLAMPEPTPDADAHTATVRRALWEAATVAYGRGFAKGKSHGEGARPRLDRKAVAAGLPGDLAATHKRLLAARNQHVAHRDDEQEQVMVCAVLTVPPLPRQAGVGVFSIYRVGPERDELARVRALAERVAEMVDTMTAPYLAAAREYAAAHLTELYDLAEQEGEHFETPDDNR